MTFIAPTSTPTAGQLRTRILIQEQERPTNGSGGVVAGAWRDIASVWAKVEAWKGKEAMQAMQVQATQWYRIVIRYRADVKSEQRIVFTDRSGQHVLNIRARPTNLDMRSEWLDIQAEEGVAA